MKKILLLSVIMASVLMPAKAYDFMVGGIAYNYISNYVGDASAKNVEVVYTDYMKSTNYAGATTINIPSTVRRDTMVYKVVSIANFAFASSESITSVSIPSSVSRIGRCAFYNCPSLKTVTIANGVTSLDEDAFGFCASLTSIVIPNSVTNIGKSAFISCEKLASATLSNAITEIPDQLFFDCKSLASVNIPNSVTKIGESAFYNCNSIKTLNLPSGLTSIGEYGFGGCSSITKFTIPNSVNTFGKGVFYDCTSLTSITLPNQLTAISDEMFYACSALPTVVIPESVTSIGEYAFRSCVNLSSITIPAMVNSIGKLAFFGCGNLTQVKSKIVNVRDVTMGITMFNWETYQYATLTVPVGTVTAYRKADIWKNFQNIIDEEGNTGGDVEDDFTPYDTHIPHNNADPELEGYKKLFDDDKSTKWCVVNSTGAWEPIWVDFKSIDPFVPTSYTMTTGNDTRTFKGRNPKVWKILGKANENDEWTTLVDVADGEAAGLGTENTTDYTFAISGLTKKYQYFRFQVDEICGNDGYNPNNWVFQLAELRLDGNDQPEVPTVKGDLNGDGIVDVTDVSLAIDMVLGKLDKDLTKGDLNDDGNIDVTDVSLLIDIVLGKA